MISSVIIPTANRSEALGQSLMSLVGLNYDADNFEILVIDNGSTDRTKEVVHEVIAHHPQHRIRYIYDPEPGLLTGRHRGAQEARGELLTFVDDDIEADPRWLAAIVKTFQDPSVQLVGGRNLPKYAVSPPAWLEGFWWTPPYGGHACGSLSLLDLGETPCDIDANYIWGLNFSIRREALFDLGGFHPDIVPMHLQHLQGDGETGLTIKANQSGYRALYQPQALVHHCVPAGRLTPEYFERREFFQGVCDSYTAIRRQGDIVVHNPSETGGQRLRRYARHPLHHARNFVQRLLTRPPPPPNEPGTEGPELSWIKQRVQAAYQKGYTFHQDAVRQTPGLLGWVLRENYWDYRLPQLTSSVRGRAVGCGEVRTASIADETLD
jgi:glucosyl-dolichyl phosphate glucuronosyltransferase